MDIVEQCKVHFFKKEIHGRYYYVMNSISPLLDGYVCEYDTINDAEILVDATREIMEGRSPSNIHSTESMATINVNSIDAVFYDYPDFNLPSFSMPTFHFLEIAEAWKNYLQTELK